MKSADSLTIGQMAKRAAVNPQTLRYYERAGVLLPSSRTSAGYRTYGVDSLLKLRFIKDAQDLGFTLSEIKELLNLRVAKQGQCLKVRSKAEAKLKCVQDKVKQLRNLEGTLLRLISTCDERRVTDGCPIIDKMGHK